MLRKLTRTLPSFFFFSPFPLTFCVLIGGRTSLHLVSLHLEPNPGVQDKHDGEGDEEVEDGGGDREVERRLVHPLRVEGHGAPSRLLKILALELDIIYLKRNSIIDSVYFNKCSTNQQPTLAKMDHGYAETTLVTQIRTIIFRALPTPVREFRVRG